MYTLGVHYNFTPGIKSGGKTRKWGLSEQVKSKETAIAIKADAEHIRGQQAQSPNPVIVKISEKTISARNSCRHKLLMAAPPTLSCANPIL